MDSRCFIGNTLVYTSPGYRYIKDIKMGKKIYSRNVETDETVIKEVEEVFYRKSHALPAPR